jgi:Zn-dependent protease with chaperone function
MPGIGLPSVVIPLALEWAILITTAAPLILVSRFTRRPRLGLVIWFAALLSAGLAIALAISVAIAGYFVTVGQLSANQLGSPSWFEILGISFGPWAALAVGGITLALINQKLEPLYEASKILSPAIDVGRLFLKEFNGVAVYSIDLAIPFALATKREVLLSSQLLSKASDAQLSVVLWHESFHVRQWHYSLKSLARIIFQISPKLAASRALVSEVERLLEVAADQFAVKKCGAAAVHSAKQLFS